MLIFAIGLIYLYIVMDIEAIREYCLSKPMTSEHLPLVDVSLVFKVAGQKMFLLLPLDEPYSVSMKCAPEYAIELRERSAGICGAFHFNKKYWNQVSLVDDVPDDVLNKLLDHSYKEVFAT